MVCLDLSQVVIVERVASAPARFDKFGFPLRRQTLYPTELRTDSVYGLSCTYRNGHFPATRFIVPIPWAMLQRMNDHYIAFGLFSARSQRLGPHTGMSVEPWAESFGPNRSTPAT